MRLHVGKNICQHLEECRLIAHAAVSQAASLLVASLADFEQFVARFLTFLPLKLLQKLQYID